MNKLGYGFLTTPNKIPEIVTGRMSLSFYPLISIVFLFIFESLDIWAVNGHPCGSPGYFVETTQKPSVGLKGALYYCLGRGVILGNELRTCQSDGQWSGDIPKCVLPEKNFIHQANQSSIHTYQGEEVNITSCLSNNNVQERCVTMYGGDRDKRINVFFKRAYNVIAVRVVLYPEEYRSSVTVDIVNKTSDLDSNNTLCIPVSRDKEVYLCPEAQLGLLMVIRCNLELANWFSVKEIYIYEEPMPDQAMNCSIPDSPAYGHFNMTDNSQVVEYACGENYVLFGDNQTVCSSNGSWSQPAPVCRVVCDTMLIDNGRWVINESSQVASLECSKGLEVQGGPPTIRCLGKEGWSQTSARCLFPDQTTRPNVINSTVYKDDGTPGFIERNQTIVESNKTTISSTGKENGNNNGLDLSSKLIVVGTVSGVVSSFLVLIAVLCFLFGRERCARSNDAARNQHRRESSYYHYYNGINYDDMREDGTTPACISLSERPPAKDPRGLPDILELVYDNPGLYDQSTSRNASTVETELSEPSRHIYSELDDGQLYQEPAIVRLSSTASFESEVFEDNEIYEGESL